MRHLFKNYIQYISAPFLFPVHSDPHYFQRWTEDKWKKEIENAGFAIDNFEIMGRCFTVFADMIRMFIEWMPRFLRWILYLLYPALDLMVMFDKLKGIRSHPKPRKFHGGYFIISSKL